MNWRVRSSTSGDLKGLWIFLAIPLLAIGGIGAALLFGESGKDRRARVELAMVETRALFEELQPPKELTVKPYGVRTEREIIRKSLSVEIVQSYETAGKFADTLKIYDSLLSARGVLQAALGTRSLARSIIRGAFETVSPPPSPFAVAQSHGRGALPASGF